MADTPTFRNIKMIDSEMETTKIKRKAFFSTPNFVNDLTEISIKVVKSQ